MTPCMASKFHFVYIGQYILGQQPKPLQVTAAGRGYGRKRPSSRFAPPTHFDMVNFLFSLSTEQVKLREDLQFIRNHISNTRQAKLLEKRARTLFQRNRLIPTRYVNPNDVRSLIGLNFYWKGTKGAAYPSSGRRNPHPSLQGVSA
jgi:hypothetical protein